MNSPVKERLTGALILIVAVVVIVPELFSGRAQKQPATDAPDAQSADAGPPLRSYTMDLGGGTSGGKGAAPTQAQNPQSPPDDVAPPAVSEDSQPAAPVAQVNIEKPALPPPAVPPPATPPTATASPATPAGRGWWVQLGSFSSRDNANRLGETLSKAGYQMQVSAVTTKGKELFRVRAGPVADRESAVALQGRLGAAGHKGTLVAPQ